MNKFLSGLLKFMAILLLGTALFFGSIYGYQHTLGSQAQIASPAPAQAASATTSGCQIPTQTLNGYVFDPKSCQWVLATGNQNVQISTPESTTNATAPGTCPGKLTNDPEWQKFAITNTHLPKVEGKPWPVTTASEYLEYFSIVGKTPADVIVDSDCSTVQIEPVKDASTGYYIPFLGCNPTDRKFNGFRYYLQDNGVQLNMTTQQGFPTGTWKLEGISTFPTGFPINAVPGACSSNAVVITPPTAGACTDLNQVASQLGLPGVTDINTLYTFFQVQQGVGDLITEVDSDCRTIQIRVKHPDTDYFSIVNPFSHLDGYLWTTQPDQPGWSATSGRTGVPAGKWNVQGITIWPGLH